MRTPSSIASHTGGNNGFFSNVNAIGRPLFLVFKYSAPVSASATSKLTPTKSPFFGDAPPPMRASATFNPDSSSTISPDASTSRSSNALTISPPSTDASNATKPKPPTIPNRRVKNLDAVATGSYKFTPDPGKGLSFRAGAGDAGDADAADDDDVFAPSRPFPSSAPVVVVVVTHPSSSSSLALTRRTPRWCWRYRRVVVVATRVVVRVVVLIVVLVVVGGVRNDDDDVDAGG